MKVKWLGDPEYPLTVQYAAQEPEYRSQAFHAFPRDVGWEEVSNEKFGTLWVPKHEALSPRRRKSNEHLSKFMQRWLFFELLRGILGDDEYFAYDVFMEKDAREPHVTTERLQEFLWRWSERIANDQQDRIGRLIRAQDILNVAKKHVTSLCAAKEGSGASAGTIDPKFEFSLIVLGQTLAQSLRRIVED